MTRAERQALQARLQSDPCFFAERVLGTHWWSKQREVAESVRDHRRTTVRSANGVGKTFTAAGIVLWWVSSFPGAVAVTTANTWNQVTDVLWREIARQHAGARFPIGGELLKTRWDMPGGRFAVGLSTNTPEAFAGFHADHLLLVVDEASGLQPEIMEAAEGYMTNETARLLLIGNPTQTSGPFFDSHNSRQAAYNRIAISAFDTPVFTDEPCPDDVRRRLPSRVSLDEKRLMFGEDSPAYDVRVLGKFPTSTEDTVISLGDVEAAQLRDLPPRVDADGMGLEPGVVTCDVARFGSDETVIASRVGNRVRIERVYRGRDLMQTCGQILEVCRQLRCDGFPSIVVDDDGVGGGVTDRLREQGYLVTAFNAGGRADQSSMYPNRRSEAWFRMADMLPGLDLDPDDQLAADLTAPRYKLDSQGRRVVEKKDDTKKRIGRSPDRADAVLLTAADVAPPATEGPDLWT